MKYLEIPELDMLSRALDLSTPTLKVTTRVEAYSCKPIARERKLFKTLESELIQDLSHSTSVSPPEQHPGLLDSAFGPLDKRESRKTLWLLIGLLNVAFPDHDFSKVRPEEFRREEGPRAVLASLSTALDHLRSPTGQRSFSSYPPSSSFALPSSPMSDPLALPSTMMSASFEGDSIPTNPFLRRVLDPIIDLSECEVFSYTPDIDSDPHAYDSDDESDDDDFDPDAFERDSDGGMTWEMDGFEGSPVVGGNGHHHHQTHGPNSSRGGGGYSNTQLSRSSAGSAMHHSNDWYSRPSTPMKSISSVFRGGAPGTPASMQGDASFADDYFGESSTGGLLWSTFHFLYNRKAKRIVFISAWARTPRSESARRSMRRIKRQNAAAAASRAASIAARVAKATANMSQSDEDDGEGEEEEEEGASPGPKRPTTTGTGSLSASLKRSASQTSELANPLLSNKLVGSTTTTTLGRNKKRTKSRA
ncbi:BZ3500_MvSof-1268-A1-R1_Chr6-2g08420 [Microbotryum saponariae]|uniref:BZ3500_MvSof-1268-A1-R1_Chr6-2g08420 protein n=1 Tax=Microbotryum saponariae TaxID=289078 RepID=A0A2X0KJU1_9BASI|nr:BZ3500_MvSof-1268-A1-R1_Chr6-2g08420 [Microbotryum saponariae]SDA07697.1 BZ3501_MvSof-1269-A2-R1_Chr6-1g08134 [Microbotryum saponariae]